MNILLIGGGGREHAIALALRKSPAVGKIWCAPGNGGTAAFCENLPLKATDLAGVEAFCRAHRPDLVAVIPDDPLALGMVDRVEGLGLAAFGPRQNAALIESSKAFAKDFMERHGIPTASGRVFDRAEEAAEYLSSCPIPIVVKADGLAAGKGVFICATREEALEAARQIQVDRVFGAAGEKIVIERFLTGPEVSIMCFTDGETIVPMPAAQDHKRLEDGDQGPNTGGMGAYSPVAAYTPALHAECMERIYLPTIRHLREEGRVFKGVIYFSLMLTPEGPMVIEYNARPGDPETQAVLPLLESDLLDIFLACTRGGLKEADIRFAERCSCCVVMAGCGYPGPSAKGLEITGIDRAEEKASVFQAGTAREGGRIVTAGGRVLCVSAQADTLKEAVGLAYEGVGNIRFEGAYYRTDIAAKDAMMGLEGE